MVIRKKMKAINWALLLMCLALALAGCSSGNQDGKGVADGGGNGSSNGNGKGSEQSQGGEAPKGDGTQEAAGGNSKKLAIELFEAGWVNTPLDEQDPFKKWIDETYNVDFKLTAFPAGDLETKLLTRFASNEPPDLIFVTDRSIALKLYNQGVLLDDWTPLLDRVPTVAGSTGEQAKQYLTAGGKLIALPRQPDPNTWSMKIRADWMANLGLQMPQTDEELLEVLRKFTFGDPDQDGEANTYGITTAGAGTSLATIAYLETMYGQPGFQVTNNAADHSILNGTHQRFLDFMKRLNEEKVIDPDWYTQSWSQQGTKLFTDKIGVVQYPSALLSEYEGNTGDTGAAADIWINLPIPQGAEGGGKNNPGSLVSGMYLITAQAAKDPDKLDRILQLIEGNSYPNDGYWKLRWGIGITGEQMFDMEGGAKYFRQETDNMDNYRVAMPGAWDYGTWIATGNDRVLQASAPEPGAVHQKMMQLDQETVEQPAYPDFQSLLTLDTQLLNDLTVLQNEFDINYILGTDTNYEAFKSRWLKAGGQQLLDSATEQYKEMGSIK